MKLLAMLKDKNGFTLVELLIVIGITVVIAAAVVPIYGNLQVSSQLNESSSQIIQTLRTARARSISRVNNSPHGVYLRFDRYTLYQGLSYSLRDSDYDRETTLDEALSLSWDLNGTGADGDINFTMGLGVPNKIGTTTLIHDVSGTREIVINGLGIVEEE